MASIRPVLPMGSRITAASGIDRGRVEAGHAIFDNCRGEADRPEPSAPAPFPPGQRVGFAIIGSGRLSLGQILPAFASCMKARPVALVSGSPQKARTVAEGVQDHVIMETLYRSAREGRPVPLDPVDGLDEFRGPEA